MKNKDVSLHDHFDLEPICLGLIEGNQVPVCFSDRYFLVGVVSYGYKCAEPVRFLRSLDLLARLLKDALNPADHLCKQKLKLIVPNCPTGLPWRLHQS